MYRKLLISIVLATAFAPPSHGDSLAGIAGPAGMLQPVDRVVVHKGSRRMELLRDGAVVATYRVSLGLVPTGQKQREGDFRTPEGSYRLTRRNAQSDFFLAVQVSYPEAADIALAGEDEGNRAAGVQRRDDIVRAQPPVGGPQAVQGEMGRGPCGAEEHHALEQRAQQLPVQGIAKRRRAQAGCQQGA